jgi:hypothetical protein
LAGLERGLSLLGSNDPHTFRWRSLGEPLVSFVALVHKASSRLVV